jgi:hypothetical protein
VAASLLIGIFGLVAGAALMSYQLYRRPAVLTLAVESSEGAMRISLPKLPR